ncbi:nuclease A inhibitor family protein [Laspinema olomoucense]|uniref:Nuclease A inhibitor family protein n=1 Tax=Laspinema olomoucense D3b TaxID=2953688 RepID=A0ABT2N6A9_9CYAN|nr:MULTISPECIES: nuclease A inhibitor family protein [unclassified Laspinema]MCT7972732.1 nuclease A inhibitor family protein [Laspinema sp. D3d]MCT7978238.1 nuclease A inhibitor family protein [Laspinema sp. D3b]MCT7988311.1 nuclease A inhibitor family protein [Laspinema sp. D3a]MCT7995799.1 nuclease A inhibitor family protein [Laspinema sp. D3c]
MTQSIIEQLTKLTQDLLWMSEADYPWEVVSYNCPNITPGKLLEQSNLPSDTAVETVSIERFFAPALREQSWHNEEERATRIRYQELFNFLNEQLNDLRVYRCGEVEIDVYVLGTVEDKTVGLKTTVVET